MKVFLSLISFFLCCLIHSQEEPKFSVRGGQKTRDLGYVSKRKALDCNKDLEWSPGTTIVFHKKSGKPYTGTCVSYYDNRKLERKTKSQNLKIIECQKFQSEEKSYQNES